MALVVGVNSGLICVIDLNWNYRAHCNLFFTNGFNRDLSNLFSSDKFNLFSFCANTSFLFVGRILSHILLHLTFIFNTIFYNYDRSKSSKIFFNTYDIQLVPYLRN